jgi:hypothetical protein
VQRRIYGRRVYRKRCWAADEGGGAILDMSSALGSVSGSKAPLTTVHAKLEAIVVRARRHQSVRQTTSKQGRAPRGSGMQQQWYLVSGSARVEDAGRL